MSSKQIAVARFLVVVLVGLFVTVACQAEGEEQGQVIDSGETAEELDTAVFAMLTETPEPTKTPAPPIEETLAPEPTEPEENVEMIGTADADVEFVRAVQSNDSSWTFHVTVSHPDTGWEDYADGWDVLLPDGTILKRNETDTFTRLLLHPHETEQPFTRSQSGLIVPEGVTQVTVRAHDLVDGFGGREVVVDLTADSGKGFEVEHN